jgi:protein tyrosine/serine phosphatase
VVSHHIYRGGQPSPDGWKALQTLGVKTVIRLDFPAEGANDEEQAKNLGMTVADASGSPSTFSDKAKAPTPEKIRLAVEMLGDKSLQPIYVHCLHGQDRTGLIVGLHRVLHDHYSKEEAYKEMLDYGFHQGWFPGLDKVWEDFDGKTFPLISNQ